MRTPQPGPGPGPGPETETVPEPRADPVADPEAAARTICLRQLTAGPRTRAQLQEAMRRRNVAAELAESVLDRLAEVGLVDDASFARAWVESRHTGRGLARRALSRELSVRGISEDIVASALVQLDSEQEEATARELLARRLPATAGLAWEVRVRRLTGLLARKGYPPGFAAKIVRDALAGQSDLAPDPSAGDEAGLPTPAEEEM